MARLYWDVLDCGGEKECCCHCPALNIDRRRKYQQVCFNTSLPSWRQRGLKNRAIEGCETPDWCPLPKLIFPDGAKKIVSVSGIFEY